MNNFPEFYGCSSKTGPAMPIQSSKLKWAWQAKLLSQTHETLQNWQLATPIFENSVSLMS